MSFCSYFESTAHFVRQIVERLFFLGGDQPQRGDFRLVRPFYVMGLVRRTEFDVIQFITGAAAP